MTYENTHAHEDPDATIPANRGESVPQPDTGPLYEDYDLTLARAELDGTDWSHYPPERLINVRQADSGEVTSGWKLLDVKTGTDEQGRSINVATVSRWDRQTGSERMEVPFAEIAALNTPESR